MPTNLSQYPGIKYVRSFEELITTRFENGINALCWKRELPGDFNEIALHFSDAGEIATLDTDLLQSLHLSSAGGIARDILIEDLQLLKGHGLAPVLDSIHAYPRDEDPHVIPTDVYSFHADSATIEADTYLCSYNQCSSEGLPNHEAFKLVDIPEIRNQLLKEFGGSDDEDFLEYLRENCYNLHYAAAPEAKPFSFGIGNLWRIAVEHPFCQVPPCIHRAPQPRPNQPPRLLLIS